MSETASSGSATRTAERAIQLLVTVLEETTGGTLSELARATSLSPSTASRLLSTLSGQGLVRRDATGRFQAGARMKQLAAATLREDPLYELVGPHLVALVEETGETASLGVAAGDDEVLYLRQLAGTRQVQTAVWTGRTIPRRDTALGSALDGATSPRGWITSRRPDSDVTAVAVPVIGHDGAILGAISVNAPSYRTTDTDVERFGTALVRHALALSTALGAPAHLVGR
ncbi:MAG: helix-turn-helix domain-containing protein [Cellulomonas sp.]|nr:helix-turn-helix domain-containing protein [Cellulomonas sp.]